MQTIAYTLELYFDDDFGTKFLVLMDDHTILARGQKYTNGLQEKYIISDNNGHRTEFSDIDSLFEVVSENIFYSNGKFYFNHKD